jgi:hypothetical protein
MPRPGPVKRLVSEMQSLETRSKKSGPIEALGQARRLREAAEDLERLRVAEAREQGVSWRQIGTLYNISKQAAHQRFGGVRPPTD